MILPPWPTPSPSPRMPVPWTRIALAAGLIVGPLPMLALRFSDGLLVSWFAGLGASALGAVVVSLWRSAAALRVRAWRRAAAEAGMALLMLTAIVVTVLWSLWLPDFGSDC